MTIIRFSSLEGLQQLAGLTYIDLSGNKLTKMEVRGDTLSVQMHVLSPRLIQQKPVWGNFKNLMWLDLRRNELPGLKNIISSLVQCYSLSELYILGATKKDTQKPRSTPRKCARYDLSLAGVTSPLLHDPWRHQVIRWLDCGGRATQPLRYLHPSDAPQGSPQAGTLRWPLLAGTFRASPLRTDGDGRLEPNRRGDTARAAQGQRAGEACGHDGLAGLT